MRQNKEIESLSDSTEAESALGRHAGRKAMIDRSHALPIAKQAKALGISRGSVYYLPRPVSAIDLAIMRRMDELHLDFPFSGSRMLRGLLNADGIEIGRLHVATLMKRMGEAGQRFRQA
jgi:hypothetical protein